MQAAPREASVHVEFLLEEPSAEAALTAILPKILVDDVTFGFHVFEGKQDLLKQLPLRLKGYRQWLPPDWRVFVLIDEDRQDCLQLKGQLENAAREAGFSTKSHPNSDGDFQIVNRLVVEELEAWFFGDVEALREAYPNVSNTFHNLAKYREPDAITGGTWEALERLLRGYYPNFLPKRVVAQNVAPHMEPSRNRSRSFQVFVEGLKACVGEDNLKN